MTAAPTMALRPHTVRTLVAEGVLVRVRRGVLVGSCLLERAATDPRLAHEIAVRALLLTYDDGVASHESAAVLHELPLLHVPHRPVLTREAGAWRGGTSRVRVAPLPAEDVVDIRGARCTSLDRTVVDALRTLPPRDAVVIGDAALRWRTDRARLAAGIEAAAEWSDMGRARRVAAFLDPRSESPLESVSRVCMCEAHVPPPELQVELRGASGRAYRADFYWRHRRLIGEADGLAKYPDAAAVVAEKQREDDLREAGYDVIRWTYGQMLGATADTIARILHKLNG